MSRFIPFIIALCLGVTRMTAAAEPAAAPATAAVPDEGKLAEATFGGGCFWCTDAVFLELKGVVSVEAGYCGGTVDNPTYQQVGTGGTGHAEVSHIKYDPTLLPYETLLEAFWKTHDPTTLNRQGNDVGPQYRSVIFYHDEAQQKLAEEYKAKLDASGAFKDPIVTEISPFTKLYVAEKYHQNYFGLNPEDRYCRAVLVPKLEKFRAVFADKLKK